MMRNLSLWADITLWTVRGGFTSVRIVVVNAATPKNRIPPLA